MTTVLRVVVCIIAYFIDNIFLWNLLNYFYANNKVLCFLAFCFSVHK